MPVNSQGVAEELAVVAAPVVRVALAVLAAQAVLAAPVVQAALAALVAPVVQAAPVELVAPAVQAAPVVREVLVVPEAELELNPGAGLGLNPEAEPERNPEAELGHARVAVQPPRTKSVTVAHHRGLVPALKVEDLAVAAQSTPEQAAAEAVRAWAAAG
jgi:hypothetical protein